MPFHRFYLHDQEPRNKKCATRRKFLKAAQFAFCVKSGEMCVDLISSISKGWDKQRSVFKVLLLRKNICNLEPRVKLDEFWVLGCGWKARKWITRNVKKCMKVNEWKNKYADVCLLSYFFDEKRSSDEAKKIGKKGKNDRILRLKKIDE